MQTVTVSTFVVTLKKKHSVPGTLKAYKLNCHVRAKANKQRRQLANAMNNKRKDIFNKATELNRAAPAFQ